MCTSLKLPNGIWCDTVGELRKALYPAKIIIEDGYSALQDDTCLCPVNFEALAEREGWDLGHDADGDPMAYIATTRSTP